METNKYLFTKKMKKKSNKLRIAQAVMNIKKDKTTAINIKKIKNKITVIIDDVAYNCIF